MKVTLSVDLGFGFVKAVCEYKEGNEIKRKRIAFPSVVKKKESTSNLSAFFNNNDEYVVDVSEASGNKSTYYVGNKAVTNRGVRKWTEKGEFDNSDLIILLGTATTAVVPTNASSIDLLLGLPMSYYGEHVDGLTDVVGKVNHLFRIGEVERKVEFESVNIYPQGIGAYYDLIFDWKGNVSNEKLLSSNIGLILIGYRTVEYLLIKQGVDGADFIEDLGGSLEKHGMNQFLETICQKISSKTGLEFSKEAVERAILVNNGILTTQNGPLDITEMASEAKVDYVAGIVSQIKPKWGNEVNMLSNVFLGGGPSHYLHDQFKASFPNLVVHGEEKESFTRENAFMYSNANGYLKLNRLNN